ncbi:MAG: MFS transporter, partial [Anaerolineae bacterium]|nr:MFS transporter [Anaerolineae bacterium]
MVTITRAPINYRIVVIAYLGFIALGLPGGLLGVAWPSMRDTFGIPSAALGTLLIASTTGYILASMFNGRIVSRLGMGPALLLASFLTTAGLLGFAFAPGWWLLVIMGLVLGVGQGILDAGMNLYFAKHFTPRLMNWLHASFGLGAALGPLLMTVLFQIGQSWQVGYIVMAVIQLALAVTFVATLREWHTDPVEERTETTASAPSLTNSLRRPLVLASVAMFFAFTGIEATTGNWSFTIFTESRSIDIITAGQWVSLYWWSFTLGRLVFGFIADRIAVLTAVRACMWAVLGGTILFTLNASDALSFIGLLVIGFA